MKKSTEFVFQLLVTILEPLITLLARLLDGKDKTPSDDEPDNA